MSKRETISEEIPAHLIPVPGRPGIYTNRPEALREASEEEKVKMKMAEAQVFLKK
ncbi:MAG: hypothetical protein WBE27_01870 [Microgenomates group bacterium]